MKPQIIQALLTNWNINKQFIYFIVLREIRFIIIRSLIFLNFPDEFHPFWLALLIKR